MDNSSRSKNSFINNLMFAKDTIKLMEDSIYIYYPKNHFDVLPLLHKAYDNLSLALYRLNKLSWYIQKNKNHLRNDFAQHSI